MNTSVEIEVMGVFKKIEERFSRIDLLVNNAGIAGVNKPYAQSKWWKHH